MNNKIATLLLATLVATGVLVVYHEASAIPLACDYVELYCLSNCSGTFSFDDCWDYQGGRFCNFSCVDFESYVWPCWWDDPTIGTCKLY